MKGDEDKLGNRLKQSVKSVIKTIGKKILFILVPLIFVIVFLAGSFYVIEDLFVKKGNSSSKHYTSSVRYTTSSSGIPTVKVNKEELINNKLKEDKKTDEEIANMTDEQKLAYLGIKDIDIDNVSSAQVLWEIEDVFSKNLDSVETLEKLLNAEIVTQYPNFGQDSDDVDSINGVIEFNRQLDDDKIVVMSYTSEEEFNKYKENYLSSGSDTDKEELLSHFTMAEAGVIKIAKFNQEGIEIDTTDNELTLEKAQEQFGENEKYKLSSDSNGKYNGTNYTVQIQEINYLSMVEQYTMPFEYLWAITVMAQDDGQFASKLADYCYNSEIIISIYDNITTFVEEDNYIYKRREKTKTYAEVEISPDRDILYEKNIDEVDEISEEECKEYTVKYKKTKTTDNTIVGLTKADTWIVNFVAEYNSKNQDSKNFEEIKIPTETEYRQIGDTQSYSYNIITSKELGDKELLNNNYVKELLSKANSAYLTKKEQIINEKISNKDYHDLHTYILNTSMADYEEQIRALLYSIETFSELKSVNIKNMSEIEEINEISASNMLMDSIKRGTIKYLESVAFSEVAITKVEIKDYEKEIEIAQTHTENSYSTYYSKGTITTVDNTKNFVDAFKSSRKAKANILSVADWLFEALEEEEETANMVDLTKYLLNCATNSSQYGNIEIDFSIFEPSGFSSMTGIYGGNAEEKVWYTLKSAGYSDIAVAAVMGNIKNESGFDVSKIEAGSEIGFGLCQWSYGRRTELENFAMSRGEDASNINIQIEFLLAELTVGGGADGYAKYQIGGMSSDKYTGKSYTASDWENAEDIQIATTAFMALFERPSYDKTVNHLDRRIFDAKNYYDMYKGKNLDGGMFASNSGGSQTYGVFTATSGYVFKIYNQNKIDSWGDKCNRATAITIASAFTDMTDAELIKFTNEAGNKAKAPFSSGVKITNEFFSEFGLTVSGGAYSGGSYEESVKKSLKSGKYIALHIKKSNYNGMSGKRWTSSMHWLALLSYRKENGEDQIFVADVGHGNSGWYNLDEFMVNGGNEIDLLYYISK